MTYFFGKYSEAQYGLRQDHKPSYVVKATLKLNSNELQFKVGYLNGETTGLVCVYNNGSLQRFIPFKTLKSMRNYYTSCIQEGYTSVA